jgi:hypothetical protein
MPQDLLDIPFYDHRQRIENRACISAMVLGVKSVDAQVVMWPIIQMHNEKAYQKDSM